MHPAVGVCAPRGAVAVALTRPEQHGNVGGRAGKAVLRLKERGRLYKQQKVYGVPLFPQHAKIFVVRRLSHSRYLDHGNILPHNLSILCYHTPLRAACQGGKISALCGRGQGDLVGCNGAVFCGVVCKGVSHTAQVYLDGALIARHYNAYTPFSAVVRGVPAGEHTLEIVADNRFSEESALHVPNDYMSYGGISRPVSVEQVGSAYLRFLHVTPHFADGKWRAHVCVCVKNLCEEAPMSVQVTSPSSTASPADMVRSAKTRRSPARQCASDTPFGRACYEKQFALIRSLDGSRPCSFASCKFKSDLCFGLPDVVSYTVRE